MSGIDVKEEIQQSIDQIIQNQQLECKWNDKMLKHTDFEEFKEIIKNRSAAIRSFFEKNEKCIEILKKYYREPLTPESAEGLYNAARAIILNGRMDAGLLCEIATPVVNYYRGVDNDDLKTIIISQIRNAGWGDYYCRMLGDYSNDVLKESMEWIVSHSNKFCEYDDVRVRDNIFFAYHQLIIFYVYHDQEHLDRCFELMRELRNLHSDPRVIELEKDDPIFEYVDSVNNFAIPMDLYLRLPDDVEQMHMAFSWINDYIKRAYASDEENGQILSRFINIIQSEYNHNISSSEALEQLIKFMEDLPRPDWTGDEATAQMLFEYYGFAFEAGIHIIEKSALTDSEKEKFALDLITTSRLGAKGIPYSHNNSYVSDIFSSSFQNAIKYINDLETIEFLITQLLIRRQPSTYLHSYMVEEIAVNIAKEMLEKAPELFLSLPWYNSVEEVKNNSKELLEIIARGARFHDLGKCRIASVIMQQSRKINDEEFMCIKKHPDLGVDFLENKKDFDVYFDIIRGHHRTYDGKGGYPFDFDNVSSKYRILIDLITISDSADAATDITGRNYTVGKDFRRLLGELKEGAGTRYNPDIVKVIDEAPELIERLTLLTGKERIEHCYNVYHQLV